MRTFIYVDGFNLYYGALKGTPWNGSPSGPCSRRSFNRTTISSRSSISRRGSPARPPTSPSLYLRALRHHRAEVEVYFGHFLSHAVRVPLAKPIGNVRTAEVIRTEEKGSDVNLAVHLLNDGWLDAYECAVVVTNDSDIAEAMRLVTVHYGKRIGLLTPGSRRSSGQFRANANFTGRIRESVLRLSQFPNPIPGTNITKPWQW